MTNPTNQAPAPTPPAAPPATTPAPAPQPQPAFPPNQMVLDHASPPTAENTFVITEKGG